MILLFMAFRAKSDEKARPSVIACWG